MLSKRLPTFLLAPVIAAGIAQPIAGQFAPAPDTYSVTQSNSIMGPTMTQKVWRDGPKAAVEMTTPGAQPGGKSNHIRTVYDLQKHTSVAWDPTNPSPQCGSGTFGGDWGDPFQASKEMNSDIAGKHYKPSATEIINGVTAQVYEEDLGAQGKAKVWLEPRYGLMMRAQMSPPNGPLKTVIETQEVSFAKPPASAFAVPAACSAPPPAAPSADDRRIAAETGEPASSFVLATTAPPSAESCTVLFRMVEARSLAIIPAGYQIGIDRDFDAEHAPDYQFGPDAKGHMLVSGGHLTEVTQQLKNGVLRIDNAPAQFHVEIRTPNGGASTYIYRHCAGPQTTLLLVVEGLDNLGSLADWLWVKSGRQAGH